MNSAVDLFKKQFAYLEEHYGKGGTVAPPERQHASSLPRYPNFVVFFIENFHFSLWPMLLFNHDKCQFKRRLFALKLPTVSADSRMYMQSVCVVF